MYIYICVCVCVCVYVNGRFRLLEVHVFLSWIILVMKMNFGLRCILEVTVCVSGHDCINLFIDHVEIAQPKNDPYSCQNGTNSRSPIK